MSTSDVLTAHSAKVATTSVLRSTRLLRKTLNHSDSRVSAISRTSVRTELKVTFSPPFVQDHQISIGLRTGSPVLGLALTLRVQIFSFLREQKQYVSRTPAQVQCELQEEKTHSVRHISRDIPDLAKVLLLLWTFIVAISARAFYCPPLRMRFPK